MTTKRKGNSGSTINGINSILNSAFLIAILAILVQQFYFKSNKKTEARIELRKEMIRENYAVYSKINFWTELNSLTDIRFVKRNELFSLCDWPSGYTSHYMADSINFKIDTVNIGVCFILKIITDTSTRSLWRHTINEIDSAQFRIDRGIYKSFYELVELYPKGIANPNFSYLKNAGFVLGKKFDELQAKNNELRKQIASFIDLD